MSEETSNLIRESNAAELTSYLAFKKRAFEKVAESSSQSSLSEEEAKRMKKIDYFSGPGEKEWSPNSWFILDETNITKQFQKFRQSNIEAIEKKGSANSLRVMSLSFIFPINKIDANYCITSYIKNIKDKLYAYAYKDTELTKVSKEAVIYCKNLSDALDEGINSTSIIFGPISEIDNKLKNVCLNFTSLNPKSEDGFIDFYLKSLIREIILNSCNENIVYSGSDAPDPNTANKKKPDLMLGFKNRKREIYFFFVELKRPNKVSKYQVEDDSCKLMKHMKRSIDTQIRVGIENPIALGLLCEEFVCYLIRMSLVEEGVYLPVTLRKFKLPESNDMDIMSIPKAIECLFSVLEEIRNFQAKYNARTKNSNIRKFVKPSFVTKLIKTKGNQSEV